MLTTGHETRSVFERYNIKSEGDSLDAAGRLDAASQAKSIDSAKPDSAKLLKTQCAPVAQVDRAAVS